MDLGLGRRQFGEDAGEPKRVLYRVSFSMAEVWPDYQGAGHDLIEVEIYEHWLDPA